ncbi:carbohydrate kinase [Coraliomargarita sinensis]|uniref:Carbohydrate kinase n=1 Tax=Coraliomargarita sinensis TaxID=2174842 RepID=A0A317ZFE4_9BACT|nr:PfkB family carbohydrate kinase [Coraliomargarita sinensis]PXA04294.1 carbohydrate kinase [Coraliomargarita sinensis]
MDVLCAGYACVDINFKAKHHPVPDEKLRAIDMHSCGGGPAANAAVAIARLGGQAGFAGYLGNDAFGEAHLSELRKEGVDCSGISRGESPTPIACVTIKPDGQRSIVDYFPAQSTAPEDAASLKKQAAKVLLIDGHQPLLSARLLDEARELGIPSLLDAGSVHDGTLMLYNKVDYLITSEKFAREMSKEDDPRLALAALDGAAPFIACTWGEDGVYWQDDDGQHHMPAFDIEAVDTTGAGDAFHGAFALGLAEGLGVRDNLRRASATAALTCLKNGARSALPNRDRVLALSHAY